MSEARCYGSYIKCGKVFQPNLPEKLDQSEPPIVLAEVNVDSANKPMSCVLVEFSEFINFSILGFNPKINILYRLVREEECSEYGQILQEWDFEFESLETLEIDNVDTSQPTVLSYCDCLDKFIGMKLIYRLEIVQISTNNVKSYGLTNKSITATVMSEDVMSCNCNCLPYIKCGKVFTPVLPLHLSKEDPPVILANVCINTSENKDTCLIIKFSGFVTSLLRKGRFNDLTFRLVKTHNDCTSEIVNEWLFRRVFVNDTSIKEPIVYNYCECVDSSSNKHCTYTFQLVEAELSEDSYYNITNKSITAQVYERMHCEELLKKEEN